MSRKRKLPFAYCVASLALAAMLSSVRAQTFQYDADHPASLTVGVSSSVLEWHARGGGFSLEPTQGESNGWSRAVALALPTGRRSVDFGGVAGVASPFHAAGATGTVTYAFAVVRCEAPADLSTLFDTSCSVRFEPVVWPGEPWAFSTSQLASTAAYAINGASTNVFAGAAGFQLVEVFWSVPVAMDRMYIGGAPASPAWRRVWNGEIAEIVFLPAVPSADERAALWKYASFKWGVPVASSSENVVETLRSLGVLPGSLFASIVKVR